jgi:DNA polymerase IV
VSTKKGVKFMDRTIFLVDMDAFFISCEETRHPEIINRPAAVAGDLQKRSGIILTANYKARNFGIKTTMTINKALKLCPDLIIIPPDHNFYIKKSQEVFDIMSCYTPVIEKNSIDEAWLDMTGCERLIGNPMQAARHLMYDIKNELGLSCSIGISENKFLAKMASDMKKPSGITRLFKKDVPNKLWPLPVEYMYGIGKKTAVKLNKMKIKTIGELANFNKTILLKKFGKFGGEIFNLANGIDNSQVVLHIKDDVKSIGKSMTLPEDISDIEMAKPILMQLSEEIGMCARKHNKRGCKVQITIKYYNFHSITRQTTIKATCLVKDIYSAGLKLLKKVWNVNMPVRLLGISLTGFENDRIKQISIFDIINVENKENSFYKYKRIEDAIDKIRLKYGNSIINRGIVINKNSKK